MYGLRSVAHDDILLLLTDDALIFLRELECVCVRERERERAALTQTTKSYSKRSTVLVVTATATLKSKCTLPTSQGVVLLL